VWHQSPDIDLEWFCIHTLFVTWFTCCIIALACDSRCRQHSLARNVSAQVLAWPIVRLLAMKLQPQPTRTRGTVTEEEPWSRMPSWKPCPAAYTAQWIHYSYKKHKTLPGRPPGFKPCPPAMLRSATAKKALPRAPQDIAAGSSDKKHVEKCGDESNTENKNNEAAVRCTILAKVFSLN
jgi:hypothetical protein